MTAKISVIIPVYNVEPYLRTCLDSACAQTLREIEIIAIDDGSPDGCPAILDAYAAQEKRFRVIHKQNEGVGRARNDGILAANGKYLAFLDADDFYPHDRVLETLYDAAEMHHVKIAGGRKSRLLTDGAVEPDGDVMEEYGMTFRAEGLTDYAAFQYDYGYTQYIFDRALLRENNILFPPYKRFQDPPFFVRAMMAAGRFYATDCDCYRYRMVPGEQKYALRSTMDFLHGLKDNLAVSRASGLAKLHALSAMRLDKEGSFMAIRNLYDPAHAALLAQLIQVTGAVDPVWLAAEGYPLREPFVPDVFEYAVSTAEKYERLRKNTVVRAIKKLLS